MSPRLTPRPLPTPRPAPQPSPPTVAPAPFAVWPLHNMTAQLFNVFDDPEERNEVSAAHPDIVRALTARLAQWGVRARDPYWRTAEVDPRSDPKARGGAWTPWL